jgi:hypothetical protein
MNLFQYVTCNPVRNVDPFGRLKQTPITPQDSDICKKKVGSGDIKAVSAYVTSAAWDQREDAHSLANHGDVWTLNSTIDYVAEQNPECTCVNELAIRAHGNPDTGMGMGTFKKGSPGNWEDENISLDFDKANVISNTTAKPFGKALAENTCFCEPCRIYLVSCGVGKSGWGQHIANETRCTVIAPKTVGSCDGDVTRVPNGWYAERGDTWERYEEGSDLFRVYTPSE